MDKSILIEHIRKRSNEIGRRYYNVSDILKSCGMEQWCSSCCHRICDAEKVDMEHVMIDFQNFQNLKIDEIGIADCFEILRGYVDEDTLKACEEFVRLENEQVDDYNKLMSMYRSNSKKELRELMAETKEYMSDKALRNVYECAREELRSRNVFNVLRWKFIEFFYEKYYEFKYRDIIKIFKETAENYQNLEI